jgi:hypothetical protein
MFLKKRGIAIIIAAGVLIAVTILSVNLYI